MGTALHAVPWTLVLWAVHGRMESSVIGKRWAAGSAQDMPTQGLGAGALPSEEEEVSEISWVCTAPCYLPAL